MGKVILDLDQIHAGWGHWPSIPNFIELAKTHGTPLPDGYQLVDVEGLKKEIPKLFYKNPFKDGSIIVSGSSVDEMINLLDRYTKEDNGNKT